MEENLLSNNISPETGYLGDLKKVQEIDIRYKIDDMKKTVPYLKDSWQKQTDEMDKETRFIYKTYSVDEIIERNRKNPIKHFDYAIRRYFNKTISHTAEELFCRYNICEKEKNKFHKSIDFWILGVPFDLKVSSYPARVGFEREDFVTEREYRDHLIKWLYENQSQQQRKHMRNRLFILCKDGDGKNTRNNNIAKTKFDLMDSVIHSYLNYTLKRYYDKEEKVFNEINLNNKIVFSDVLLIET